MHCLNSLGGKLEFHESDDQSGWTRGAGLGLYEAAFLACSFQGRNFVLLC